MVEAIQFIPIFRLGTLNDLYRYEKECKWVLNSVNRCDRLIVLKSIIHKLSSEGFEDIKNINIATWRELKAYLRQCFETYTGIVIRRCGYCKRGTHESHECPKRFRRLMRQSHEVITEMPTIFHLGLLCSSQGFYPHTLFMLAEHFYNVCIIKISYLYNTHEINTMDKRMFMTLDGIVLYSYGSTELLVEINSTTYRIKFDVVNDQFPISGVGIIGPIFWQN